MKISCDIIRDLLPLYAEDMCSEASKNMVDDHLCQCDPCTKQLAIMKKAQALPVDVDTRALKRVGDTIHRRKVMTVVTAILTMITVLVSCMGWLLVDIWPDAEDAVVFVENQEDGSLRFLVEDYISGMTSFGWQQDGYAYESFAHAFRANRLDYLQAKWDDLTMQETKPNFFVQENNRRAVGDWDDPRSVPENAIEVVRMEDCQHWFLNVYQSDLTEKMWGEDTEIEPEPILAETSMLQKTVLYAAVLCAGFGLCAYLLRKSWLRELFTRFAVAAGSVVVSTIFLTGGKFISVLFSDEPNRTLKWVYAISALLTLTILFWRQLHLLTKQDKGV